MNVKKQTKECVGASEGPSTFDTLWTVGGQREKIYMCTHMTY